MDSELKMFDNYTLSEDEEIFLKNVNASRNTQFNERLLPAYQVIADMYLTKQIEKSTEELIQSNAELAKENGRYANSLNRLTLFLVILTIILVVLTIAMLLRM
ncbi:MAG: hypothetical protein ACM3UZ_14165 [Acidobacteriota bacterium]